MDFKDLQHVCMGCMSPLDNPSQPCSKCGWRQGKSNGDNQLRPGTVIDSTAGRYVFGRALGQGGFGITYIAGDVGSKVKVAIKEYYPGKVATRSNDDKTVVTRSGTVEQERFFEKGIKDLYREADTLAKFSDDPNIVTVRAIFKANGTAYIVMEFVEGKTLKEMLAENPRPMPLNDVVSMLKPMMKSLAKVHAAGIVHRDISPDNIIFTEEGIVKLIDFGAARSLALEGEQSLTVMFKMGYAPPEQFQSHGKQGPWTDVYALASTIYHAVTAQRPVSTMDRWMGEDTLLPPSSLPGVTLTPAQEQVVLKGMALKIEDRYQSVQEFYKALRGSLQGINPPSPPPPPPPPPEPTPSFWSIAGKKLVFVIVAVVLIVGLLAFRGDNKTKSTPSQTPTPAPATTKENTATTLNDVQIGMTTNELITVKGSGKQYDEFLLPGYTTYDYGAYEVIVNGTKVCAVQSKDPSVSTNKGIHTGSSEQELKKSYGTSSVRYSNDVLYDFASSDKKKCYIGFRVKNGAVQNILMADRDVYDFIFAGYTIINFHNLITKKEYDTVYDYYLTEKMKSNLKKYDDWKAGYRNTVSSTIKRINSVRKVGDNVEITYDFEAVDNPGGTHYYTGKAIIKKSGQLWVIDSMENR